MTHFHVTNNATQSVTASTFTEVDLQTELVDSTGAFASNRYTVPAGDNGKYMLFSAGVEFQADETAAIYIDVSTNGGSSWTALVQGSMDNETLLTAACGPVLLNTGDIYRLSVFSTASVVENSNLVFFSGIVLPDYTDVGRVDRTGSQWGYTANTDDAVEFNTEDFDTAGALSVSPAAQFTVQSGDDGRIALFNMGIRNAAGETGIIKVVRDSASPDEILGGNRRLSGNGRQAASGFLQLSSGETFSPIVNLTAGDVADDERSFFSYLMLPSA